MVLGIPDGPIFEFKDKPGSSFNLQSQGSWGPGLARANIVGQQLGCQNKSLPWMGVPGVALQPGTLKPLEAPTSWGGCFPTPTPHQGGSTQVWPRAWGQTVEVSPGSGECQLCSSHITGLW